MKSICAAAASEQNAALFYSLASTGLSGVPAMVNLNFHAMVHRDAIYFKDSINPPAAAYITGPLHKKGLCALVPGTGLHFSAWI